MPSDLRTDYYDDIVQKSQQMTVLLDTWMSQHNIQPSTPVFSCTVPELVLADPPLLGATSKQASTAIVALSKLFSAEVTELRRVFEQQYQHLVHELAQGDTHSACVDGYPCSLLRQLGETLRALFDQKVAAMSIDLGELCRNISSHGDEISARVSHSEYVCVLEFAYGQSRFLNKQDLASLSRATGRPEKQISIWFQNRRARDKNRAIPKREPPRTIDELEVQLRAEHQFTAAFIKSKEDRNGSSDRSQDTGYHSAQPESSADFSVDDLARLLEQFHIFDSTDQRASETRRQQTLPPPRTRRRVSTSSEDSVDQQPSIRPRTYNPRRKVSQAEATTALPERPYTERPVARLPRRRPNTNRIVPGSESAAVAALTLSSKSLSPLDTAVSSLVHPLVLEAVSSNKARRSRKPAPLPTRRPARTSSSGSLSSSCPSLASSRASSLSSGSSLSPNEATETSEAFPAAKQLYYKDAQTGEFVPIAGASLLTSHSATDNAASVPVCGSAPRENAAVVLERPRPPQFAPDHDPRAFSTNLLQPLLPLLSEPVVQVIPLFELSCPISDIEGASAMHSDNSAIPHVLDPLAAFAAYPSGHVWVHHPSPLDLVADSYDPSWTTHVGHANSWAQLLGVDL